VGAGRQRASRDDSIGSLGRVEGRQTQIAEVGERKQPIYGRERNEMSDYLYNTNPEFLHRFVQENRAKEQAPDPLDAANCSVIRSTPEHGLGEQEMTFRMAANAIWNKLNFAMSLVEGDGQLMDLLFEARALADSIVRHPKSGSQNVEDDPHPPENDHE